MTRIIYKVDNKWNEIDVDEVFILGGQLKTNYIKKMHPSQEAILELSKTTNISELTLREIGEQAGIGNHPQLVKHHLEQLYKLEALQKEQD